MAKPTYTLYVKGDGPIYTPDLEEIVNLLQSGNTILAVNVTYMKTKIAPALAPVKFTPASFKEN